MMSDQTNDDYREVYLNEIRPGRYQPRRAFDALELHSLAASIRDEGLLNAPIVFLNERSQYELIAGERRWRALCALALAEHGQINGFAVEDLAEACGFTSREQWPQMVAQGQVDQPLAGAPVTARVLPGNISAEEQQVKAIIDNIQRQDLSRIEEAHAYARLRAQHGWGVRTIAEKVGKSKSYVDDTMKLLELEPSVLALVESNGDDPPALDFSLAREMARKIPAAMQPLLAETLQKRGDRGAPVSELKKSLGNIARFIDPNRWSLSHDADTPFHPVWRNRARLIRHMLETQPPEQIIRAALNLEGKGDYNNYLTKTVNSILNSSWDVSRIVKALAGLKDSYNIDAWQELAPGLGWGCEQCSLAALEPGISQRVDRFDGWDAPCQRLRGKETDTCDGFVGPDDPQVITVPDIIVDSLNEAQQQFKGPLQGQDAPYVASAGEYIQLYELARHNYENAQIESEAQAMTQHIAPIAAYWQAQEGEQLFDDLDHFQAHACRKCVYFTKNYIPGGAPPCTLVEKPPMRNNEPRPPAFGVLVTEGGQALPRCEKFSYRELPPLAGFEGFALPNRDLILEWYKFLIKDSTYGSSKHIFKPLNWLNSRNLKNLWDELDDGRMLAILHAGVVEASNMSSWGSSRVNLFNPATRQNEIYKPMDWRHFVTRFRPTSWGEWPLPWEKTQIT